MVDALCPAFQQPVHQRLLIDPNSRDRPYFATMRYEQLAALLLASALFGISCKKDEARDAPVVTIIAPNDGFSISVPDTLLVSADVSGKSTIDRVSITLTDANGVPVTASISVVPSSNPARIGIGLPLLSDHIASGNCTLTVQAVSGDRTTKDYRHVNVTGTPRRLRAIMVLSQPVAGAVQLHRIDSVGDLALLNTFVSDLGGAVVSSYDQTLGMMGPLTGPLSALAPDGVHVRWQQPNLSTGGIPWFTSLDALSDDRFYVGGADGALRGFNALTGASEFVSFLAAGFRAQRAARVDDHLLVAEKNLAGTQYKLRICQAFSGALLDEQFLDKDIIAMIGRDATHALLFGNRNAQGVVEDRDLSGGGGWEPHAWTSPITAVTQAEQGVHLVALANGDLERFTYANAGSTTIASGAAIRTLAYDPVGGAVYAGRGTEVVSIDPSSGTILGTWSIGADVAYVLVLLNK